MRTHPGEEKDFSANTDCIEPRFWRCRCSGRGWLDGACALRTHRFGGRENGHRGNASEIGANHFDARAKRSFVKEGGRPVGKAWFIFNFVDETDSAWAF
jgi:hypothetical protein